MPDTKLLTFDEFIAKYTGQKVDWDGAYGEQCVDLYRRYCAEVLGIPQSPSVKGAVNIATTFLVGYFDLIKNTLLNYPKKGDIIIWNEKVADGLGHVSVVTEAGVMGFKSFDVNWPTGSLAHVQSHNYTNVVGWLVAKNAMMSGDTMPVNKIIFELLVKKSTMWDKIVGAVLPENKPEDTSSEDVLRVIQGYKSRATDLQNKLTTAETEWHNREEQVSRLQKQLLEQDELHKAELTALNNATAPLLKMKGEYEARIVTLQGDLDTCSKAKGALNQTVAELEQKLAAGTTPLTIGLILKKLFDKVKDIKL